jgi:peptide/nickel transport system substrate-binding protein
MSNRLHFATLTAILPLAMAMSAAQAATPKDSLVMAMDIADIITMDHGESSEISGQEMGANISGRIVRSDVSSRSARSAAVSCPWVWSSRRIATRRSARTL